MSLPGPVVDVQKTASRTAVDPRRVKARSRVTNGGAILAGLIDGRGQIARRYTDLISQVVADLGGAGKMSEAKMQLTRRFAALSVQCEDRETRLANGEVLDVVEYSQLTSTLVRVVSRLGINRVAKDIASPPHVSEYLEHIRQKEAAPP